MKYCLCAPMWFGKLTILSKQHSSKLLVSACGLRFYVEQLLHYGKRSFPFFERQINISQNKAIRVLSKCVRAHAHLYCLCLLIHLAKRSVQDGKPLVWPLKRRKAWFTTAHLQLYMMTRMRDNVIINLARSTIDVKILANKNIARLLAWGGKQLKEWQAIGTKISLTLNG